MDESLSTQARFRQIFEVDDASAGSALDGLSDKAESLAGTLKKAAFALGAAFSLHAIKGFTDNAANVFEETRKLAQAMGTTGAVADAMADAFAEAGVETSALQAGVQKWAMALVAARKGQKDLGDETNAWSKVGDAAMTSYPEAMALVARRIEGAKSEQEKLVIATEHFGRAGKQMLPILSEGESRVREIMATKGGLFSEDNIAKAHKYHVTMSQISDRWEETKASIGLKLMPMVATLAERFMPHIESAASALASIFGVVANHAELFAASIKVAAGAWIGMKIQAGVSALIQGAIAMRTAAAAATVARVGGAGLAGSVAGGAAAGAAGGPWGAAIGAGLGLAMAGYTYFSGKSDEDEAKASTERFEHEMAQRAVAEEKLRRLDEAAADTSKRLERATGLSADALKELGFTIEKTAADVAAGGHRLRNVLFEVEGEKLARKAEEDEATADRHAQAALKVAGILKMQKSGIELKDYAESAKERVGELKKRLDEGVLRIYNRETDYGKGLNPSFRDDPRGTYRVKDPRDPEIKSITDALSEAEADLLAVRKVRAATAAKQLAEVDKLFENPTVQNNFNGPITIQNDLRGEDPDRVMFGLDNLMKLSEHRTTSRLRHVFAGR